MGQSLVASFATSEVAKATMGVSNGGVAPKRDDGGWSKRINAAIKMALRLIVPIVGTMALPAVRF